MNPPAWRQANITFPDRQHAETTTLARLAPLLRTAEDDKAVAAWFFIRKHPCWRVRYLPATGGHDPLSRGLDALTAEGSITAWTKVFYEPEVHAFGGSPAMDSAHRFFHRDSRHIIDFLPGGAGRHRRETSLMLCSLMMRSARLDWYEQGDVWARVATHRAPPAPTGQDDSSRLLNAVHRLITVDGETQMRSGGPLAHTAAWADVYTDAGRELAHLTDAGQLRRGLRDVLAHHILFAWNRMGLPHTAQALLAAAAKTAVFGPDPTNERGTARHVETC
ncbi:thiopeptide-type bacteriocin biosynthesis protein [Streptomyces sp. NPDC059378]|uniref:thiopeptide-type bacteriocin biosynthesis protein n=1 Tax=Streptomyces sp. NPDC059378 TaxID=3346815 RepID=UPI0036B2FC1E